MQTINTVSSNMAYRTERGGLHWIKLIVFSVIAMALSSCQASSFLPSRALEIDLQVANKSVEDVAVEAEAYLQEQGLRRMGKGGYDEIHGTENTVGYESKDGAIIISISVDREMRVPIRISSTAENFPPEADALFEGLKVRMNNRWPNSTQETTN
ncbi:hypothetical protein H0E84_06930 [Luteimonas sp. SJ-92]|uniref:DUF3568 family protein n=1 Tax=Luteimonas salinisoli TaxID=2752307 RepID=A0A853JB87_9GAMM|nr:hypothetical protein [Luteimonas salinisoli]NZA26115.1 hypothetical protein [Luteimonas salinisoli]